MNKMITTGRIIFAIGIMGLGVICIISGDFIVGRPPAWPASFALNPGLGYVSGALLIMAALAVATQKYTVQAASLIAALILFLSVFRELPHFMDGWLAAYKTLAFFGSCLILVAAYGKKNTGAGFTTSKLVLSTGILLLAVFFMACGYAHFKYADFVNGFIPAYIPFHPFWTYFCGIALAAGGLGLLIPPLRYWAALLSAFMLGGWFILLHIPRFLINTNDASDRMGLCESFALCGIFLVLAGLSANKKQLLHT